MISFKLRKKIDKYRRPDKFFPRIWEDVDNSGTMRIKIYGGWIVYSSFESTETMCFVPDPDYKWKLIPFISKVKEK